MPSQSPAGSGSILLAISAATMSDSTITRPETAASSVAPPSNKRRRQAASSGTARSMDVESSTPAEHGSSDDAAAVHGSSSDPGSSSSTTATLITIVADIAGSICDDSVLMQAAEVLGNSSAQAAADSIRMRSSQVVKPVDATTAALRSYTVPAEAYAVVMR
jgi:hypothetical protein